MVQVVSKLSGLSCILKSIKIPFTLNFICSTTFCRIGHSRSTHSYLINNKEQPEHIPCNFNHSPKHQSNECVMGVNYHKLPL